MKYWKIDDNFGNTNAIVLNKEIFITSENGESFDVRCRMATDYGYDNIDEALDSAENMLDDIDNVNRDDAYIWAEELENEV